MPTSENHSKEITIVLPEDTYFIANLTTDKRCMYNNNICNAEINGSASVSYLQGTNFTSQPDEAILYDTAFTQNEISINFWGTNIHNGTVVEIIYNNNGTQDDQSLLKISADTFGNCTINNVTFAELFKQDTQPHFYSFGITFSGPIHVWVDGELVAQTNNVQHTYFSGYQISIGSLITGDIMSSQNFNSLSVTNQLWGNDVNELIGKHCGVPPVEIYDSPSSVINYYNITTQILNNGHAGTITPTNPRVAEGNNKVFNIVAGEGNYIYFIKLDDVEIPGVTGNYLSTYQYTLENIRENHIIRVTFMNIPVPVTYSFTSSKVNGELGTIYPDTINNIQPGESFSVSVEASLGNYIDSIVLNGVELLNSSLSSESITTYTINQTNVQQNYYAVVTFKQSGSTPATYNFTSSVTNGSCTPASAIVYETGSLSVIVTPNQDYEINSITINGTEIEVTDREEQIVTVENISGDIHLVATCVDSGSVPVVESYYTLVSDPTTEIPFHIDNTPLSNFETSGADTSSITINGQSVVKNTIKELCFGDEYNVTTSINNYFLSNLTSLSTVDISALSNVTSIGDTFLSQCSSLTSVDLSSFVNVTSIGDTFLSQCSSLTSVDLPSLSNVSSVGNSFLQGCSSLTSVDLPPFSNTTSIGNSFLQGCSSLTSVDLSGLSNVTSISYSFLSDCSSLTSVDLSGLSNVTSIGSHFLYGCSSLTSVDLSPFSNVTSVVNSFLRNCSSLTSIDLSPLSNVTTIKDSFLDSCSSLTSIDLSPLSNVTTIGKYFLSECSSLTSVTIDAGDWSTKTVGTYKMSGVNNIATNKVISNTSCELANNFKTAIGESISNWTVDCPVPVVGSYYTLVSDPTTKIPFHFNNTQLTNFCTSDADTESITINDQSVVKNTIKELCFGEEYNGITSINNNFLRYLTSLSTVDLSSFSNVTSIGEYFLSRCSSLTSVDLSVFSNVTSIGHFFLYRCSSLTSIDLSPFSNVTSVHNNFLYYCTSLTSIDLSPLSNVTTIANNFLSSCTSLTSIDLSPLNNITSIALYFLYGCSSLTSVTIDAGDWSTKSVGNYSMSGVNNIATNKVISNTSCELANNFKTKIGESISNWTVDCPVPVVGSYYTLVSDPETRIPFHIDNTPLANFCTADADTESITINNQSVVKNTIKELSFGEEYSNTTVITQHFLRYFSALSTVDLSVFSNVTSIGNNFLNGCSSLTSIDLSPFSNVTTIGSSFINGCLSLTSVDLSPLSNVTSIGNYFLSSCTSLTSVDLSGLSNVTSIGTDFLHNCSSLTSVDLSGLSNVTSIDNYFLQGCSSLTSVDFSGFSNVTSINNNFLYNCYNLTSIDLSSLSNVTSIGNYFLTSCTSLTSIDLSPFSNVTSIGTSFLDNCTSLTSVTIDAGDWSTKTVGNYAMQYVNNTATNKVISNTSCELANNFKTKIGAAISNWTVQCPV